LKYKNLFQLLIKKAQNMLFEKEMLNAKGDTKQTWSLINEAT